MSTTSGAKLAGSQVSIAAREILLIVGLSTTLAGAAAHLFGIGCGAIVSFLGHRAITFGARAK